jgi:hypothetical protein
MKSVFHWYTTRLIPVGGKSVQCLESLEHLHHTIMSQVLFFQVFLQWPKNMVIPRHKAQPELWRDKVFPADRKEIILLTALYKGWIKSSGNTHIVLNWLYYMRWTHLHSFNIIDPPCVPHSAKFVAGVVYYQRIHFCWCPAVTAILHK